MMDRYAEGVGPLDAARLVLRGGLATGDHELAIELALRALEGR